MIRTKDFIMGKKIKTGGRVKGTPNKVSAEMRDFIKDLLEGNKAQLRKDFLSLEPKDRISIFCHLVKFVVPALQSVDLNATVENVSDPIEDDLKSLAED